MHRLEGFPVGYIDVTILIIYFAGMAVMGAYFARRNTSTEEYFVGGRSFAGWVVGLSLVGTSISSVTFLAYPADAFKTAWLRYIPNLALPVVVFLAIRYFLPVFCKGRITSAYEFLEGRFGPSIRVYAACVYMFAQVSRVSIILYLIALVAMQLTGLPPEWCIVIGGVVVAAYTIAGGIDAVIWTDVIQTVLLLLGGILCLGVIIWALPGGLPQIFEVAWAHHKFALADPVNGSFPPTQWGFSLSERTVVMLFLVGATIWIQEYSSGQHIVQRYACSKSTHEARKAMWVCVGSSLPIWAFYMFLGTALYVYFQVFPDVQAAEMLDGTRRAEEIVPYFVLNMLPAGVSGLVIAAALAAAMSSLDSSINSISTVGVVDIYKRYVRPGCSDRHYLWVARGLGCVAGALMIGGALALSRAETRTLQDTGTILASLVGGGLAGLYLLGFFSKRGRARAVWAGLAATLLFTGWSIVASRAPHLLPSWLQAPFDLYYTNFIGNILMFSVAFTLASFGSQAKNRMQEARS